MAESRRGDHRRLTLRLEAWPAADCAAWASASAPGDLLDRGGPAAGWSAVVTGKRLISYGRWLGFLSRTGQLDLERGPGDRITRPNVEAYLAALREVCASVTCWSYVSDLAIMVEALDPDGDHAWLRRLGNRLHARMQYSVDRRARLVPVERLYREGLALMARAPLLPLPSGPGAQPANRLLSREVAFRDGLMLALLAACPLRRRSFVVLELGRHLVRRSDRFWLQLEPRDLKNGADMDVPIPATLTPWLDHYLAEIRPRLLGSSASSRLWVSRQGSAMTCHSLSRRIERTTLRLFGHVLSPHLFRHCAATSVALDAPTHVGVIPALLGHRTAVTGERYYNLAGANEAAVTYQAHINRLRSRLRGTTRQQSSR